MNRIPVFLIWLTVALISDRNALAQNEEFVGPFDSWANVKTRFGAKGDGKTDDTKKIQQAINQLANFQMNLNTEKNPFTVIYFPAGTYIISETLLLEGKIGVSIIGEDPATTIIKWVGKNKDTMLLANGSAYFKISRFTWDGNGRRDIEAVGVHWLTKWDRPGSRSYASLNIELSDMDFRRCAIGIGGGTMYQQTGTGSNDSEVTIRRCNFYDCTEAGIRITGFNALDYWIWYCRFNNCKIGVYNAHGNYHLYKCNFNASTQVDIHNKGGYYTSVRECYSFGSREFSFDEGVSCNPFKRIFQKNTVVDYKTFAIEYYHLGNLSLYDNNFSSKLKNDTPDIGLGSWCPGFYSVLSVNNRYTAKQNIRLNMERRNPMQFRDVRNTTKNMPMRRLEPVIPSRPLKSERKVFEVPQNATAEQIQRIINIASSSKTKAVIHFPPGKFRLDRSLVIPQGSDLYIVGDGLVHSSRLVASNFKVNNPAPLIIASDPSSLRITDIQLGEHTSDKKGTASIELHNIDQKGARLIVDQLYSSADTSMFLSDLNYLYVEKDNSFFSDGNFITGGIMQQEGKGTFTVNYFGGQFSRLTVRGGVALNARDCWWEGGSTRTPLEIKGDGIISLDGAMISPYFSDAKPSIVIGKFNGKVTLSNIYLYGGIGVEPQNDKLDLLCWNIHFYHNIRPIEAISKNGSYRALMSGISCQCFEEKNNECGKMITFESVEQNIRNKDQFIDDMTALARRPMPTNQKAQKLIYLSRVSMGTAMSGIKVLNER